MTWIHAVVYNTNSNFPNHIRNLASYSNNKYILVLNGNGSLNDKKKVNMICGIHNLGSNLSLEICALQFQPIVLKPKSKHGSTNYEFLLHWISAISCCVMDYWQHTSEVPACVWFYCTVFVFIHCNNLLCNGLLTTHFRSSCLRVVLLYNFRYHSLLFEIHTHTRVLFVCNANKYVVIFQKCNICLWIYIKCIYFTDITNY